MHTVKFFMIQKCKSELQRATLVIGIIASFEFVINNIVFDVTAKSKCAYLLFFALGIHARGVKTCLFLRIFSDIYLFDIISFFIHILVYIDNSLL